jgi:hypothetical protein
VHLHGLHPAPIVQARHHMRPCTPVGGAQSGNCRAAVENR